MRQLTSILICLVMGVSLFSSCSKDSLPSNRRPLPEVADQSLIFYLTGQSLQHYFKRYNIPEICEAIDNDILYDSRLFVHVQSSDNSTEALLIEYWYNLETQSSCADTLRRYPNCNTIEKAHIVKVIDDVAEIAPSNRYAMVLGSHGGGWVSSEYKNFTSYESGDDEGELFAEKSAATQHFDLLHKSDGADATRWFGENMGDVAEISVWAEAFKEASVDMEYLIFDACFMSNVETLYELRDAAKFIVASPCEIMGRGVPYNITLPHLFSNFGKDYDLKGFIGSFVDYYSKTNDSRKSGCMALTVCSEMEALAEVTSEVYSAGLREIDIKSIQSYEGLSDPLFVDFEEYIMATCTDDILLSRFIQQLDKTLPKEYRMRTDFFYSGYNNGYNVINHYSGVSTSDGSIKYPKSYENTLWAKRVKRQ